MNDSANTEETTYIVQIRKRGQLTLPVKVRKRMRLPAGDVLTMLDMGSCLVLMPKVSVVDRMSEEVASQMKEQGITLEELLSGLDEERERYYRGRYEATS